MPASVNESRRLYRIGPFELDADQAELRHQGAAVPLEPKAFSVLTFLVEQRERAVSQDELLEQVWPGRVITSDTLYRTIKLARLALAKGGVDEAIKTVHRVGYRFIADVDAPGDNGEVSALLPVLAVAGTLDSDALPTDVASPLATRTDITAIAFTTSRRAVEFALQLQSTQSFAIALHVGERAASSAHVADAAIDLAALAEPGQTLLSSTAYELARAYPALTDAGAHRWVAHGSYQFQRNNEVMTVFQVGNGNEANFTPPDKPAVAIRSTVDDAVLGWRAAANLSIPGRQHWILQDCLGSGGFGEAWLAEHQQTDEQRVFKFCYQRDRLRSLQREVTLFRVLRESLGARRDIARILDWRFDEAPYFVESEYTAAGDLTRWAASQGGLFSVPLETRLELISGIARAAASAHAVGVLHKDIKPTNVLVDVDHGGPQAVLADFGIGTLTTADPLVAHSITALGMTEALQGNLTSSRSGTRTYQAPEILEGKPASIQADIYSLGVVAYQMIVGDLDRVLASGWERDVDDPILRQDIAAMVDRDPTRRPADANRIAEQLESLSARHDAQADDRRKQRQLEREQRRRRFWMPVGAALLVFAMAMGWQNLRVSRALEEAKRNAATAEQTTQFMSDVFANADPLRSRADRASLGALLADASTRIDKQFASEPAIATRLLTMMGRAHTGLADYDQATQLLEKAVSAAKNAGETLRQAEAMLALGNAQNQSGSAADAGATLREALTLLDALPETSAVGRLRAQLLARKARSEYLLGDVDSALASAQAAVSIEARWLPEDDPDALFTRLMATSYQLENPSADPEQLDAAFLNIIDRYRSVDSDHYGYFFALFNYGLFLETFDRLDTIEQVTDDAVRWAKERLGGDHPFTAGALYRQSMALGQLGKFEQAQQPAREALSIRESVLGPGQETATSLADLAELYRLDGDPESALHYYERSIAMIASTVGSDHWTAPGIQHRLGLTLRDLGQLGEALRTTQGACETSAEIVGVDHWRTPHCNSDLAAMLASSDNRRATQLARDALNGVQGSFADDHWIVNSARMNLAEVLYHGDEIAEALKLFEQYADVTPVSPAHRERWADMRRSEPTSR